MKAETLARQTHARLCDLVDWAALKLDMHKEDCETQTLIAALRSIQESSQRFLEAECWPLSIVQMSIAVSIVTDSNLELAGHVMPYLQAMGKAGSKPISEISLLARRSEPSTN